MSSLRVFVWGCVKGPCVGCTVHPFWPESFGVLLNPLQTLDPQVHPPDVCFQLTLALVHLLTQTAERGHHLPSRVTTRSTHTHTDRQSQSCCALMTYSRCLKLKYAIPVEKKQWCSLDCRVCVHSSDWGHFEQKAMAVWMYCSELVSNKLFACGGQGTDFAFELIHQVSQVGSAQCFCPMFLPNVSAQCFFQQGSLLFLFVFTFVFLFFTLVLVSETFRFFIQAWFCYAQRHFMLLHCTNQVL